MIHSKYIWKTEEIAKDKIALLAEELGVSPVLAEMLSKRKVTTKGQLDKFFHPDKFSAYDPFLLKEMDVAVERIKQAIHQNEKIMIYGDYDADGVTSIAVLFKSLEKLGAQVDFYIPNRFTEGYGPNKEAFQMIKNQGYDLLITVDNGIAALDVMDFAKEIDLDVIVTDHHEKRETLPEAVAVIHPRHPLSEYPFHDLAGVGVSYKLSHALLGEEPEELLDLVAVGTVADLVSLTDENRLLVQKGLQVLRNTPNLGLQSLAKKAGAKLHEATEETIGFSLAPRLNAVGRLGDADPACELLLAQMDEEADELAQLIDEANKERRALVQDMTKQASQMVEEMEKMPSMIVVSATGWNAGVLGIVASRLVEKFGRPTICLAIDEETGLAKGSGRSVPAFHLYQELDQNRDLLEAFGGHPMAAGLTLRVDAILEFTENMEKQAAKLSQEDLKPALLIEDTISLETVSLSFIQMVEQMAPFGTGNPKPLFKFAGVHLEGTKQIGADKTHLKTFLKKDEVSLDAVGFNIGHLVSELSPAAEVDVVGELSVNEWNNVRKPQLRLVDLSVAHWQVFDVRNRTEWNQLLREKKSERIFICFEESSKQALANLEETVVAFSDSVDPSLLPKSEEIIFADIPQEVGQLERIVQEIQPEKIYFHFNSGENHAMDRLPDRKAFASLYGLIKKFQPFSLNQYEEALTLKFGWSKQQIEFMSGVFFELNFVKMEGDMVTLQETAGKRNLEEAELYQRKERELETRQKLLYASYSDLLNWMKRIME
ncbi:single-stranded-DNA-specific exonuclease RecJ [Listeria aquatica]|uniref:Single-stranded-DNA-specific exonuclease RecJ n=1 Tax=Listeria aquatica TaxID=1494960 RepID=A0A841ZNE0_9LIST|nr:single-stranded-DNA-specific exonuclease RecJ [Listeria aquatica]